MELPKINLTPLNGELFEEIIQEFICDYPGDGFEKYSCDEIVYFLMQEAIDRHLQSNGKTINP